MAQVYRTDLLQNALRNLCDSLQGVRAAVIVSVEGFVVASHPPGDESFTEGGSANSSQMAAMAATLVALAERTMARLAQGEIERMLVEGRDGVMIVVPATDSAAIAVLLEKGSRLGIALYAGQFAAQRIRHILEGSLVV
ncbi:MAG: roadblock/LC7 domain-containing protein [Anaerolineales bacterium]|nr:MAG: roadblock/LC7 domain-containing protein [Anaerolineales bacterium]